MRALYYILLVVCGMCGLTILAMLTTLIYGTEPVSFRWAVPTAQAETSETTEVAALGADYRAACEPIVLDEPPISYRTIANFAEEAVIAVNTFDFLDWDEQIPETLNRYFEPTAARIYIYQFQRSELLQSIRENYYTVNALPLRPPLVVSSTVVSGSREWKVQVPVRLYYRTGANTVDGTSTDKKRDQVFTVRIVEMAPTDDNFRGVGVQQIIHTRIRETSQLDELK